MRRVCIVTATRAEYGLLMPLIKRIQSDDDLELDLIVTGTHLSVKHGRTVDDIIKDGFEITHEIPILEDNNSPVGISITMANALKGFAHCFKDDRPDIVIILGDRTEMLAVASAALNEMIPIAHIHGGEVTEGAVDDCIRHAITKMSRVHFVTTDVYRNRVIQLGEEPETVFNVGSLGAENILTQKLMNEREIRNSIGIPPGIEYSVVTFHPVTMEHNTVDIQIRELCKAMDLRQDIFYVITGSNSDAGGDTANRLLTEYSENRENVCFISNLGMKRYLSAVKHAIFVLGNSSSGLLEAPVLGTPTVNVGDRQKGRLVAKTVICCEPLCDDIVRSIDKARKLSHVPTLMYGDGNTSKSIVRIIKQVLDNGIASKKHFVDLEK